MAGLTDTETRLVEDYLWVIDLVSRCAQGLDGGDWYYLADKAQDLARRAERLADTAAEIAQATRDDRPGPRPRREAVRAAVAVHGRHYRAGRLLHPTARGVLMPKITIHVGGRERLEPAISKATPMGALGTEALVWIGTTRIGGPAAALRALADALVEAAQLADEYDADPDAFNQREQAEREADR